MNKMMNMLLHDGLTTQEEAEYRRVFSADLHERSRTQLVFTADYSGTLAIRHLGAGVDDDDIDALDACFSVSRREGMGGVLTSVPRSADATPGSRRVRYMAGGVLAADVVLSEDEWVSAVVRWSEGGPFLP